MTGPRRIICLTEETTETLYRLGVSDRIVGISAFTVRPPEAKRDKPVVSQFVRAKIDDIVALKPDLILGFSDLQSKVCAELIERGLEVYCFNQRSIRGILGMVSTLGRLVGETKRGDALAAELLGNVDAAREAARQLPVRPRVFFEEWPDPIITGIRWVVEIIEAAGGDDCFNELSKAVLAKDRIVAPAEVIERKPDLYLASWCGKKFSPDTARARPGFADALFTQEERMVAIDSSVILQPGPAALSDGLAVVQREIARVAALMQ